MSKHLSSSRRARGLVASFAAVALGVTGLVALATSASAAVAPCVPQEAWTETIPAVGTPTIPNPDYKEAWSERVNFAWTGGPVDGTPPVESDDWQVNNGEHNGQPHQQPDGVPYQAGGGNSPWFLWLTIQHDAEGDPTIPNPDYVPEQVIEHQAVICETVVWQWHTWQTSLKDGVTTPINGSHVTWPQTYVGAGKVTPTQCGVWYQQDLYKGTSDAIAALYADGFLTELAPGVYEDAGLVKAWVFVYGGDCVSEGPTLEDDPTVEEGPPVVEAAPVVKQATLAETGFPLLGVLGLAGSFSLIGGGLVNARRLLR